MTTTTTTTTNSLVKTKVTDQVEKRSKHQSQLPFAASVLAPNMKVVITKLNGEQLLLDVNSQDYIGNLKMKIYDETGIQPKQILLLYENDELPDVGKTLSQYKIQDGATINLVIKVLSTPS